MSGPNPCSAPLSPLPLISQPLGSPNEGCGPTWTSALLSSCWQNSDGSEKVSEPREGSPQLPQP